LIHVGDNWVGLALILLPVPHQDLLRVFLELNERAHHEVRHCVCFSGSAGGAKTDLNSSLSRRLDRVFFFIGLLIGILVVIGILAIVLVDIYTNRLVHVERVLIIFVLLDFPGDLTSSLEDFIATVAGLECRSTHVVDILEFNLSAVIREGHAAQESNCK
jgi:hypothetical protein